MMQKIGLAGWIRVAMASLALSAVMPAVAETFPTRPVRIVVATTAGGWGDVTTRLVAQRLSEKLGQPVVIDNRPGADGLVGFRHVKSSPADGYTLLSTGATLLLQPTVKKDPGYELLKDFTGVGVMARSPSLMVAAVNSPDKSLSDYMTRAKAEPGSLNYGSAGVGSATHIPVEMLAQQAGLKLMHIPYKGNAAAMSDLIAGRVHMLFDSYGSSAGNLKGGRLKALGVTASRRLRALPDVPTFAELGVPGFSYHYWLGLFAPAGTPPEVVQRLSTALREALSGADLNDKMQTDGTEPMVMLTPEFNNFLRTESGRMNKLASDLGWTKE